MGVFQKPGESEFHALYECCVTGSAACWQCDSIASPQPTVIPSLLVRPKARAIRSILLRAVSKC